ncbi:MAG: class F sortase [Chloroflexota bacterium]|nr:class F sortase [Chloroflexota bacterium]
MSTYESHLPGNSRPSMMKFLGLILVSSGLIILGVFAVATYLLRTPSAELESLNAEYGKPTINAVHGTLHTPNINQSDQTTKKETISKTEKVAINEPLVIPVEINTNAQPDQHEVENFSKLLDGYGENASLKKIHPKSWSDPDWLLPDHSDTSEHNQDNFVFRLVEDSDITVELLSGIPGKISIPILNLTAPVENLGIVEKDGREVYETPKNLVGRIPSSPNQPDSFTGWYFGHLESPLKGEGNVFHNLPEIAEHLINGNKVLISLEKPGKELVYQVTKSEVVHESDLELYDPGLENIILVTCSNRPIYDHRQLVTATLVGAVE